MKEKNWSEAECEQTKSEQLPSSGIWLSTTSPDGKLHLKNTQGDLSNDFMWIGSCQLFSKEEVSLLKCFLTQPAPEPCLRVSIPLAPESWKIYLNGELIEKCNS